MRALLASPLGLLIGVSLGMLGGGGSILAVPALVYAAGQTPTHATAASLVLVAVSALTGLVPQWRAGRVRVGAGTVFGVVGAGGSLLGSRWNRSIDPDALLLAFSAVMLVAAAAMWRRVRAPAEGPTRSAAAAIIEPAIGPTVDAGVAAKVLAAGTAVGLLTGFFGVGGGFVIVPALVLVLDFEMPVAVGTSLLVITVNSLVALTTRLQPGAIDWAAVAPFTAASMIGVAVGARLGRTRDPRALQGWFAGLLVAVALYTATRSGLALR